MLALGATPGRAFLGGTGLEPILHAAGRGDGYRRVLSRLALSAAPDGGALLGTFEPGSYEAQLEEYLERAGADPGALTRVLDTFVDIPREALAAVEVPTLVVAGDEDNERGSVEDLAAVFPIDRVRRVPGDHWTALTSDQPADELVGFLSCEDRPARSSES